MTVHAASDRRHTAALVAFAFVSGAVAVGVVVAQVFYGYHHRDMPAFAFGLAFSALPAAVVWSLPLLVFVPRAFGSFF